MKKEELNKQFDLSCINNDDNDLATTVENLEKIKEICSRRSNEGLTGEEYKIYDRYTDLLYNAWETWGDEITREFWEGDKKPDEPTEPFKEDFFDNFDFEEEFGYLPQITSNDDSGTEWLHTSEIIDNPDTLEYALKAIGANFISDETGIYASTENFIKAEKYCLKYDAEIQLDFTKEDYDRYNKDYATFEEFMNSIVDNVYEMGGGVYDIVFIANDAYNQIYTEYYEKNLDL